MLSTKIFVRSGKLLLLTVLLGGLTGCYGVVEGGYYGPGYYGGPGYYDYGPDVTIFGGWGEGHHDHDHDRDFARRGAESRGAIGGGHGGHSGGGHAYSGGHSGGGGTRH